MFLDIYPALGPMYDYTNPWFGCEDDAAPRQLCSYCVEVYKLNMGTDPVMIKMLTDIKRKVSWTVTLVPRASLLRGASYGDDIRVQVMDVCHGCSTHLFAVYTHTPNYKIKMEPWNPYVPSNIEEGWVAASDDEY
jgi:hypothetical protein